MKHKVLVIATHPDDETLGCGGTILNFLNQGHEVYWLIVTTCAGVAGFSAEKVAAREVEIDKVAKEYKFTEVVQLKLKTTTLDTLSDSEMISHFSTVFNRIRPNVLILPFGMDAHSDHGKVFRTAFSCTKSFRYPFIKKVMMMETLSETEFAPVLPGAVFMPQVFVDVSETLERKIEIMRTYKGELGEHPFPRSEANMRALATFRGASCGKKYAESFMLLRETI